jgi:CTP synthase (UTP-ammonia lyase)
VGNGKLTKRNVLISGKLYNNEPSVDERHRHRYEARISELGGACVISIKSISL